MKVLSLFSIFVGLTLVGCGGKGGGGSSSTSASGSLQSGDAVEANRYYDAYLLRSTESGQMALGLESSSFDPYLILGDEFGNLLDEDDDSGTGLNSLISYPTGFDEDYIVVVTSALQAEDGNYRLHWSDNLRKINQITSATSPELAVRLVKQASGKEQGTGR
jgi:hypothetical protein